MENLSWLSNLLVIVVVSVVFPVENSVVDSNDCRRYGNDVCLCHQNPACRFSTDNCVGIAEACEDFQFSEMDCVQDAQFYATNGVICKHYGNDGGTCDGKEILFLRREPSYFKDVSTSSSEEFGEAKNPKENDLLVKAHSVSIFNEELCIVYQIPVNAPGHYQITLEKTSDAPGATLDIMVNDIVVLREINQAHLSSGQRFHLNYFAMFDENGQLLLSLNEDTLVEIQEHFIHLKICQGMCSVNRVQKSLESIFLRIVKVMKFKSLEKLNRQQRDITDQVKLNVGLDTGDRDNTTAKPHKNSTEEGSLGKKKTSTTAKPTATTSHNHTSSTTSSTTPTATGTHTTATSSKPSTTTTHKPTTILTTQITTTEDPTMPIGGRSMG